MTYKFTKADEGKRVTYVGRSGRVQYGVLRGCPEAGHKMVDVKLDGSTREVFFVPDDAVNFVEDENA
jgi:hypothetical protein